MPRATDKLTQDELDEALKRKAESSVLTDEMVRDHLLKQRRKAAEQSTEVITRPADRLKGGRVDPAIEANRRTKGIPEPKDEAPTLAPCFCPTDGVEMAVSARNGKGEIVDRRCPVCGLTESSVVGRGQGHLLYPGAGVHRSIEQWVGRQGDFV